MQLPDKDLMRCIILYIGLNSLAYPVVSLNALLKGFPTLKLKRIPLLDRNRATTITIISIAHQACSTPMGISGILEYPKI
jgi:hypothetical protein